MATITRSQAPSFSAANSSCPTCKTPLDKPLGLNNNSTREMGFEIFLRIKAMKAGCPACKAAFDQLDRNARTYWTKKKFQKWAETAPFVTVNRIVLTKKKYIVKFHRGTTLRLRHGDKVSILRVPNRWTRVD